MFIPRALNSNILPSCHLSNTNLKARNEKLIAQIPGMMKHFIENLEKGYTFDQALEMTKSNIINPLLNEIDIVILLNQAGAGFEHALESVADKLQIPEFDIFVTACINKGRTRIEQIDALKKVAKSLERRNETQKIIQNMQKEANQWGGITIMTFLTTLITLGIFNRNHIAFLFTNQGIHLLNYAMALMLLGMSLFLVCSQIKPDMEESEIQYRSSTLAKKLSLSVAVTALPALLIISFGPFLS